MYKWALLINLMLSSALGIAQFSNVTIDAGINHLHVHPQFMGGGAVFFDLDGDGWEDLYLTGGVLDDKLYLNDTQGGFIDISDRIPFQPMQTTSGVIAGDVNADGCTDLFLTNFDKTAPNYLMMNDCQGGFINESRLRGINHNGESIGGSFLDYDQDGDLDIYVANYIESFNFIRDSITNGVIGYGHFCQGNFLYKNDGLGNFEEVAQAVGAQGLGCTLATAPFITEDSLSAIYIANDYGAWIHPNELLVYDVGLDTFTDQAEEWNIDAGIYGMGIAIGDVGNDLDNDLYVSNIGDNVLYENEFGRYSNNAEVYDVENTLAWGQLQATSWGTFFLDVENDGDLDLFVANGFVPSANFNPTSAVDANKLYIWTKSETFEDKTEAFQLDFTGFNRGCVYGDYDNDGDLDILIATLGPDGTEDPDLRFQLYRNDIKTENTFLKIKLKGNDLNVDAFGATAFVYPQNGTPMMRTLYSGGTHASQNSTFLHFGLAGASAVDSIKIVWPDHSIEIIPDVPVDKTVLIEQNTQMAVILGCTNPKSSFYEEEALFDSFCEADLNTSSTNIEIEGINMWSDGTKLRIETELGYDLRLQLTNSIGESLTPDILIDRQQTTYIHDMSSYQTGIYIALLKFQNSIYSQKIFIGGH